MRIEADLPDDLDLKYIYAPSMVDRGKWLAPGWLVYATSTKCPTYYGAFGIGATLQAACDHAARQVREYVARNPQGAYNVSGPIFDLDLSSILDGF